MDTFSTSANEAVIPSEAAPEINRSPDPSAVSIRRDYLIGILLLLCVVALWTASNYITQYMFVDGGFEKPFAVTYLNTSSFAVYLALFYSRQWMRGYKKPSGYQPLDTNQDETSNDSTSNVDRSLPPLSFQETFKLGMQFCVLWFIANWSLNASLDYTSVAIVTILSSMSGFFTLGLGKLFKVEELTLLKVLGLVTSFIGVCSVSLGDTMSFPSFFSASRLSNLKPARPFIGDSLALLGALFYALYIILLKVKIQDESRIDMQLFFGFVGLINILAAWPIAVILHFLNVERLELPSSRNVIISIIANMIITLLSDYIYVLSMLKTSPIVATIGLSLTIPLSIVIDFFIGKPSHWQVIVGACLVLASFTIVGIENGREQNNHSIDSIHGNIDGETTTNNI